MLHSQVYFTLILGNYCECYVSPTDHANKVYFYEFEYEGSYMKDFRPSWHTKCDHGFDVAFTSGSLLMKDSCLVEGIEVSEEDMAMAKVAVKYWSNFVKTG